LLAERGVPRGSAANELIDVALSSTLESDMTEGGRPWIDLIAAAGHSAFGGALSAWMRRTDARLQLLGHDGQFLQHWARRLGLYGDESLRTEFAESIVRLDEPQNADCDREFACGYLAGCSERVSGKVPSLELDPATFFAWPSGDASRSLDVVSDSCGKITDGWNHLPDIGPLQTAVAWWNFEQPRLVRICGAARAASVDHATWIGGDPSTHSIHFSRFGGSTLELDFELASAASDSMKLILVGLVTDRPYFPYSGSADIGVELDKVTVGQGLPAIERAHSEIPITLAREHLTPGYHRIRVRALDSTTTVYRLFGAVLRVLR
jgi:hypothetical protein